MSNAAEVEAYNRREIRQIAAAFKAMDDQAVEEAKEAGGALAEFLRGKIIQKSYGRSKASAVARGISEGSRVATTQVG